MRMTTVNLNTYMIGMRIAVFRKGKTPKPTVAMGLIVEPTTSTTYSKVRVKFDSQGSNQGNVVHNPRDQQQQQLRGLGDVITANVSEPFWVQESKPGSAWQEPDEWFVSEAKGIVSHNDKRVFWEMIHVILERPNIGERNVHVRRISNDCTPTTPQASSDPSNFKIRNLPELNAIMAKPQYRFLWIPEAAQYLPKEAMAAMFTAGTIPMMTGSIAAPATEQSKLATESDEK